MLALLFIFFLMFFNLCKSLTFYTKHPKTRKKIIKPPTLSRLTHTPSYPSPLTTPPPSPLRQHRPSFSLRRWHLSPLYLRLRQPLSSSPPHLPLSHPIPLSSGETDWAQLMGSVNCLVAAFTVIEVIVVSRLLRSPRRTHFPFHNPVPRLLATTTRSSTPKLG